MNTSSPTRCGVVAVIGAPGWHVTKQEDRSDRAAAQKPSNETLARAMAWQGPQGDAA